MERDTTSETSSYPGSVPMVKIDGARIRALRETKKLTQLYLSTVVGVTTDTISRWENRHYQSIKLENAEKLAQALEVPFEDILKQEEQRVQEAEPEPATPAHQEAQPAPPPPPAERRKLLIGGTLILIAAIAVFFAYSRLSEPPPASVAATRILPPHVSPGQTFPVLIRITAGEEIPVSLIIKELIPGETTALTGLPEITSVDTKENSLKWIRRQDTGQAVYAYLCRVQPGISLDTRLTFSGTLTLKQNVNDRQAVAGAETIVIAPYHWADTNRDYMIDDEEILALYDTYSGIEELALDRELIDSIWASSSYKWDAGKERFIPVD